MIFSKPNHHHVKYFIAFLLIFAVLYGLSYNLDFTPDEKPTYGITYSAQHAESLNIDPQAAFIALLDDIGIRHFRLSAYWNETEPHDDEFNFERLDWQIQEVRKRGGSVTLALGRRLPRWPECHQPQWAKSLTEKRQQEEILEMIPYVIEHYKEEPVINRWQVENEPLLPFFGDCPTPDVDFLKKEIELVRSLDNRPIIITASGELGNWSGTGQLGDTLGVSLYRTIWKPIVNYITYPLSPAVYAMRQKYVLSNGVNEIILSELQAEPWSQKGPLEETLAEQYRSMNPEQFIENVQYARESGFSKIYIWGAEWWYWLKTQKNQPQMWEAAKKLWESSSVSR